ncbi:nucleotide-binding universal stress UspA family protein [Allocatelliglobosispora scoriae]|uniref:Nucleotide-binding universal stress UspA family protein n=1 Tax=Allocatelliglobosispora scoriae TaxID=643052 RepID=A0A841BHV8_9ACTN|nr:universal stress protein [Allocatelliglobosispora scoriae]MBB5867864.1 nucleotide-binding universal stress UspA family protein [Allocatelliglobosispora scoriae]
MTTQPDAPIVAGTDGSASADTALRWAADEAHLQGRPLRIVHVLEFVGPRLGYDYLSHDESSSTGRHILDRARATVLTHRPDLDVSTAEISDDAAHALIAESDSAAMVVVGSRGHGGFHDMILGSTSLQTATHARSPVAVVRPQQHQSQPPSGYADRHLVVGVDGSSRSALALELAFAEAERRGIGVTAIHAWQRPVASGFGDAPVVHDTEALTAIETALLTDVLQTSRDDHPNVPVEPVVVEASAAGALVAASAGAELVVVGCRGHGGFTGLLLGSVSVALIHHAHCPVLVAHSPQTAR